MENVKSVSNTKTASTTTATKEVVKKVEPKVEQPKVATPVEEVTKTTAKVETPVAETRVPEVLKVKLVKGKFYYAFNKTFPNGQAVEVTTTEMRYLMNQTNGVFEEVK